MSNLLLSAIWNAFWKIHSTINERQMLWIFWAQQLINTRHKRLHVDFTDSCERMNYTYTLWLGSINFPKAFSPFQKPRCQKSYIKGVNILKFRHWMGVVAHMIWKYLQYVCNFTHSCKWLSSLQTLEMQSPHVFWRLYKLKSQTLIIEKN